jgi:hypothetical protein
MQEVRSSSLRSSTGQNHNSNTRAASTAVKYSSDDRGSNRIPVRLTPGGVLAVAGIAAGMRIPKAVAILWPG